jgi:hypothetical protein
MGQVTIYLDKETERKLNAIVGDMRVSKSKWIADLIRVKTATSWPASIVRLAGAWKDFPMAENLRGNMGIDAGREPL